MGRDWPSTPEKAGGSRTGAAVLLIAGNGVVAWPLLGPGSLCQLPEVTKGTRCAQCTASNLIQRDSRCCAGAVLGDVNVGWSSWAAFPAASRDWQGWEEEEGAEGWVSCGCRGFYSILWVFRRPSSWAGKKGVGNFPPPSKEQGLSKPWGYTVNEQAEENSASSAEEEVGKGREKAPKRGGAAPSALPGFRSSSQRM